MSKKSKSRAKDKRSKEKASRKAAKKALYQSFRDSGKNNRSKRFRLAAKRRSSVRAVSHPNGKCGNPGCRKCFAINFHPFLNSKGQPEGMPHWMWLNWKRQIAA